MGSPRVLSLTQLGSRIVDEVLFRLLDGIVKIFRALPSRWIPPFCDGAGRLLYLVDARGRKVGRQNLRVVFGDGLTRREKREILIASFGSSVRSICLLFHASPMTSARFRRWVEVPPEVETRFKELVDRYHHGVLVSGHLGSWELLLGLPAAFPWVPPVAFLAEGLEHPALDRLMETLRGTGGAASVRAGGGARAVYRHVSRGGIAALLADRNVRRLHGGIWAPFLGLMARTTPLPAWVAVRERVPVIPVLCLPGSGGRYRIWVGPVLSEGVPLDDPEAAVEEITRRVNEVLERVIRERPDIWNWTLKRFKSRPTRELGPYPPYSLWDPDERADWAEAKALSEPR